VSETTSKVDQAIVAVRYAFKKKKKALEQQARKVEITPAERIEMGADWDLIRNVETVMKFVEGKFNELMGKIPPQAIDLEEAVLGAIILEVPAQAIVDVLEAKHFYPIPHQRIFEAIQAMRKAQEPIDMRSLVAKMRRLGTIEEAGGAHYIAELTSRVSSAANVSYHAHIVIEMAMRRQMIISAGKMLHDCYDETTDTLKVLDEVNDEVKILNSWVR
jgi:hypothetical protein